LNKAVPHTVFLMGVKGSNCTEDRIETIRVTDQSVITANENADLDFALAA